MMKVAKLTRLPEVMFGETACFYPMNAVDGIESEIELSEIGDKLQIEIVEMSKHEFEKLPEFEGW